MRRRPLEVVEAALAGGVWAALVIGMAVTVLLSPEYTALTSDLLGIPATAGLAAADVADLSERVRVFVAEQDPGYLPVAWAGAPAFDARTVSHLVDVRRVILGGRAATGVAAGALAAYLGICVARRRRRPLADSMRVGAAVTGVLLALALVAGIGDFQAFFAGFHGLFFAPGTWTFSYDSLIIRLFPARFWATAAGCWAALSGLGAGLLLLAARHVAGAREQKGSIRTAEDV